MDREQRIFHNAINNSAEIPDKDSVQEAFPGLQDAYEKVAGKDCAKKIIDQLWESFYGAGWGGQVKAQERINATSEAVLTATANLFDSHSAELELTGSADLGQ